ncbi:PAS domain-containing protein [Pseudooceanicola sp. C21-150M6]|uniref:PAS domain-containing protein n=1 Tax=Pseudooceanicola sp. C21-150M6 TaxID=3434355 RepID=UPI003D7F2524
MNDIGTPFHDAAVGALIDGMPENAGAVTMVIDQSGLINAVSQTSPDLLGRTAGALKGAHWIDIWRREDQASVDQALSRALGGHYAHTVAETAPALAPGRLEISLLPLHRDESAAIATLSPAPEGHPTRDDHVTIPVSDVRELLHAMANVASISGSSARVLSRSPSGPVLAELASGLEAAAQRTDAALTKLRHAVYGEDTDDNAPSA